MAREIHKALPRLELQLYEYQTAPMLEKLSTGQIDLGILALPVDMDGLEARQLYEEPFALAVPAQHRLAKKKDVTVDDLKDETLLLLEDGHCLRDQALDVCSRVGVQEKQDFRATSLGNPASDGGDRRRRHVVAGACEPQRLWHVARRRDAAFRGAAAAPLRRRDLAQDHGPASRDRCGVRHHRKARTVRHNFEPSPRSPDLVERCAQDCARFAVGRCARGRACVRHCADRATLVVQNPWIRKPPPGLDTVAVYFTREEPLRSGTVFIVGMTSPLAANAMIHETSMVEGQSRMRMRDRVTVPGGGNVAFEPEGLHVMLTGLTKPLEVGDKVPLTLRARPRWIGRLSWPPFVRSTRSEPAPVNRPESPADHVTPYDRFAWSDTVVEHLLASGEHPRELTAYFGASEYAALAALAREAQRVPVSADAPRVYLVPGIMGSQLGRMRRAPLPNDILWLDPVDISLGQLALLRLPVAGSPPVTAEEHKHPPLQDEPVSPQETQIVSLGVVLFTYLRLKLHLRIRGVRTGLSRLRLATRHR